MDSGAIVGRTLRPGVGDVRTRTVLVGHHAFARRTCEHLDNETPVGLTRFHGHPETGHRPGKEVFDAEPVLLSEGASGRGRAARTRGGPVAPGGWAPARRVP